MTWMKMPQIIPAGDNAIKVRFEERIERFINAKVHELGKSIMDACLDGIYEVVPAFRTLTIFYDPLSFSYQDIFEKIEGWINEQEQTSVEVKKIIEIPVCYDESFGPDLSQLSSHAHLTIQEIIKLHTKRPYYIYMLGFLPGFPYLGGLDERLSIPRLSNPRVHVDSGSVGIAGSQTGLYTMDSPGGWRILGRTPLKLFDPNRSNPIPYKAGEWIQFKSISKETYECIRKKVENGTYEFVRREENSYDTSRN